MDKMTRSICFLLLFALCTGFGYIGCAFANEHSKESIEKRHSTRLSSMMRSNRRARGNAGENTTYFTYLHRNHRKDGKARYTTSDIDETQDSVYYNQKGSVLLDASVFSTVEINDLVATCSHCHRSMKLSKIFNHYTKTTHRFFYDIRPVNCKK